MEILKSTVDIDDVKYIESYYKKNYRETKLWREFLTNETRFFKLMERHPVIKAAIHWQFVKREALQSGHLNEIVCGIAIATHYKLTGYYDPMGEEEIPEYINKNRENIIETTRFTYGNDDDGTILLQLGGPNDVDFIMHKNGKSIRFEVKDVFAKAGEKDMPLYDENGIFYTNSEDEQLNSIARYVNSKTNIFALEGSNYHDFDEKTKRESFEKYCKSKKIDKIIFRIPSGNFVMLDPANDSKYIDFDVAELRPAGRNPHAVFTPQRLNDAIVKNGGRIDNGKVYMPISKVKEAKGRGTGSVTRIKIGSLFFVKTNKVKTSSNFVSFNLIDVQQLKPTFSIHMRVNLPSL